MSDHGANQLLGVAKEWLLARNVIKKFLQELDPRQDAETLDHNAAAIIARLAHENMLIQVVNEQDRTEEKAKAFDWMHEMACHLMENAAEGGPRWVLFDVDDEVVASGNTPLEAVEAAMEIVDGTHT